MTNRPVTLLILGLLALPAGCGGEISADPSETLSAEGRRTNCTRDTQVDLPATVAVDVLSSRKVHVKVTPAQDSAGVSRYVTYKVTRPNGTDVLLSSRIWICSRPEENILDGELGPLWPDTTLAISVLSTDGCGNTGESAPVVFHTPPLTAEANPPTVSTPYFGNYLAVRADDDTLVWRAEFYSDGNYLGQAIVQGAGGTWVDGQPAILNADGKLIGDGPNYYPMNQNYFSLWSAPGWIIGIGGADHSTPHLFEVRVFDMFGNVTTTNATL